MRKGILSTLAMLLFVSSHAQNNGYDPITGTTDFEISVVNSINSVPNLRVSGLRTNVAHVATINPGGVFFHMQGSIDIDRLTVSMPDGKSFQYLWNSGTQAFECSELGQGYMASIPFGSIAINISNASALGKQLKLAPSGMENFGLNVNRPMDYPSNYYGHIPDTELAVYGTSKDGAGNTIYLGKPEEVLKVKAAGIQVSAHASGISPQFRQSLEQRVKHIREEYSSVMTNKPSENTSKPTGISGSSSGSATSNTKSANSTTTNNSNSTTSNKASSEMYQKAEQAGQSIQQREYERQAAERQRQERLQQATNPGGYYLQKSGVNDYFNAQMDRLNREAAAKERQEEREWLARERRERAEEARREREREQWRKDQLAKAAADRAQRLNEYNAKGGDANYNTKLSQWRTFAQKEFQQVNAYLKNYQGDQIDFAYPQNNCQFVQAIENVQNSQMPNDYKLILIKNVLNVRFEYYEFYRENGYNSDNWRGQKDNMYWDIEKASCGNFLDGIAFSLGTDIHKEDVYGNGSDIFGADLALSINNSSDSRLSALGNYSYPIGITPTASLYKQDLSDAGIKIPVQQITGFTNSFYEEIWSDFHLNPFDWSNGYIFREKRGQGSDGWFYNASTRLAGNKTAIDAEIQKYVAAYDIQREFSLNTISGEEHMMFFHYNRGALSEAYEHLNRYIMMQFGGYDSLIAGINKQTESNYKLLKSAIALTGVLVEVGDYENAKPLAAATFTKAYQLWNQQFNKKPINTLSINQNFAPIYIAANVLKNRLHFVLGEYNQMSFPKDKEAIENNVDRTDAIFKYVRVTSSRVWAPTPDELEFLKFKFIGSKDLHLNAYALMSQGHDDLAKLQVEQMVKYYSKKDAPAFIGTSMDIDIFQKLVKKYYSNKTDKINYKVGLPDLLKRTIATQSKSGNRYAFLTRFTLNSNSISALPAIDLTENAEWSQLLSKLEAAETNEESLSETFFELHKLGNNGILVANEASKNYLSEYIQLGITIGRFHEVLPAFLTFKTLFPEDDSLRLEEELSKLMWPQKENIVSKILETKYNQDYTQRTLIYHPTRTYFEEQVRNNEALKSRLNMYTFAWSKFKVSGIQIPYIYSLN